MAFRNLQASKTVSSMRTFFLSPEQYGQMKQRYGRSERAIITRLVLLRAGLESGTSAGGGSVAPEREDPDSGLPF